MYPCFPSCEKAAQNRTMKSLDLFACFRAQCSNIAEPSAIWSGWPQWLYRKLVPLLSYTPDAGGAGETLWTGAMRSEVKMGRLPGCRYTLHGGEAIPRLRRFLPIVQSGGIFNSPHTIEASRIWLSFELCVSLRAACRLLNQINGEFRT